MKTLYIDTHSNKIELAIFIDGKLKQILYNDSSNQHSSVIMPLLNELLNQVSLTVEDLTDIIVINGPGSFTGIRLGVTIAKTLAYTLEIPIRVMSSLLIKAISNSEKGYHWFSESEKNGYFVGEFNDSDELLNDYLYIKKSEYAVFKETRNLIENVELDYEKIFDYSRLMPPLNPHLVKPLYVKLIEVQK